MEVKFFHKDIKKFIATLEKGTYARVMRLLYLLEEYGNNLSMPYSKNIGQGLFELRTMGKQKVRLIYTFHKGEAILLHVFLKNKNNIPHNDLKISLERKACFV